MTDKNWIIEISNDSGETWKRWPSAKSFYTEADASQIVQNIHDTNLKLMAKNADHDTPVFNLDRYQARCSPAPPEPKPEPVDNSVLARRKRGEL